MADVAVMADAEEPLAGPSLPPPVADCLVRVSVTRQQFCVVSSSPSTSPFGSRPARPPSTRVNTSILVSPLPLARSPARARRSPSRLPAEPRRHTLGAARPTFLGSILILRSVIRYGGVDFDGLGGAPAAFYSLVMRLPSRARPPLRAARYRVSSRNTWSTRTSQ